MITECNHDPNFKICDMCSILNQRETMQEALEILQKYNRIRNDTEAYLYTVAEWGLGICEKRPIPGDYGIDGAV